MAEMTTHRFRHMPIVERGRLIGIVSIGDVVKMRIAEAELFKPGVLGIAVEQLELAPGESTAVYVVREREATE